ncbi:MAG: AAA family ATPase [Bryobacteraceae bacterium]
MEAVLLIGIPASGKSTFCRERFFSSHVRLNLDMLRTRRREAVLLEACLAAKAPFVVDNTNLTRADRARYIVPARAAGFSVHGYFLRSRIDEALIWNCEREGKARVPDIAIRSASARLELPNPVAEGFDSLHFVRVDTRDGQFIVEPWKSEE